MSAVKKKRKKKRRKKEVFSCVRAALVFAFNYSVLGGKLRYRGAEYRCGTSWVPQSCVVTVCFVAIYHHRHVFYCTDRSRRLGGAECGRRGEGGGRATICRCAARNASRGRVGGRDRLFYHQRCAGSAVVGASWYAHESFFLRLARRCPQSGFL